MKRVGNIVAIAIATVICMSMGCERESSRGGVGTITQETPSVLTATLTQETPTVPTLTSTPESARELPTSTAVPSSDRHGPIPTPREDQRPPKKPLFCDEFDTWREANAVFITFGGPEKDPYGMDPDGDGIPCEALREQKPDG